MNDQIKILFNEFYRSIQLPTPQWEDLASNQQKRLFFLLLKQKNIDREIGKMKAKMRYKLLSFNHITKNQISELIDILNEHEKTSKNQAMRKMRNNYTGLER